MKGNWDSSAILAASAVFPLLGGPEGEERVRLQKLRSKFHGFVKRD